MIKTLKRKLIYRCHDACVVDSEELMRGGDHINSVRLTLGTLAVKELIDRLISRLFLKNHLHYLKQGFM